MKQLKFDPDMTYLQSLKHVTLGLIQFPADRDELHELKNSVLSVMYLLFIMITRLILLLTLPLSAPLVTLVVQTVRNYPIK